MILTQCAACAVPLPHTAAKQCSRCKTRYCGHACQAQHWKEGGHDKLCKKIKKSGGAEQYHADKKYKEAVAVAVEKCADDTKGQTCYICTEALHWKTKEGLVRMCACRGTAGFAHVSCLAEQVKILVDEVIEKNPDDDVYVSEWMRWVKCSLCEANYHGIVRCALRWACWKTYVGRPDIKSRGSVACDAIKVLGAGLTSLDGGTEEALAVFNAELAMERHLNLSKQHFFATLGNIATCYNALGRQAEALITFRDVFREKKALLGAANPSTIASCINLVDALIDHIDELGLDEARSILQEMLPVVCEALGHDHQWTLHLRRLKARTHWANWDDANNVPLADCLEAERILEDACRRATRALGPLHPETKSSQNELGIVKKIVARGGRPIGKGPK